MTGVLVRAKVPQTERGDSHMQAETQIGAGLPQAKENGGLPEARRGKEGSPPRAFGGNEYLMKHFDFSLVLYPKRWLVLFLIRVHA